LIEQFTWFFFMTFYHVFLSWLSIKVKRSLCFLIMTFYQTIFMFLFMFFFMFLFMFFFMIFYQMIFMFLLHVSFHVSLYVFLYVSLHVSLHVSLYVSFYVFLYNFLSNDFHVFSLWLSIKKIMQKDNAKVEKISIFNSFNVKLKFLMSWIELTQFSIESSYIELKIYAIWLKLSWKCK